MSKKAFNELMRYTHFANSDQTKVDPFWKVFHLLKTLNKMPAIYVEKSEYVAVDESVIRYFGPSHSQAIYEGKTNKVRF